MLRRVDAIEDGNGWRSILNSHSSGSCALSAICLDDDHMTAARWWIVETTLPLSSSHFLSGVLCLVESNTGPETSTRWLHPTEHIAPN